MKIAFWSNTNGKSGTTSNMACLSVICSMMEQKKSVLFENHCSINNLEHMLIHNPAYSHNLLREQFSYYDQTGLESLIKRVHANHTYQNVVEDLSVKFLEDLIYYLPRNLDLNQEYFEFELNQVIRPLLFYLDGVAEYVFVDTACNNNLSTKTILNEAELVVVNLCQSESVIEHFFQEYKSLQEKAFFLVGNYQPQSIYNLKNLRKKYKIPKERIGVIPYNIAFHDALCSGTTIEFLSKNFACKKEDENYYFISQIKEAAERMLKMPLPGEEESVVVTQ